MIDPADYQRVVSQSKLLNEYQKQAFLDHPDELPEDFKEDIISLLNGFSERSQARDRDYTKKLKEIIAGYRVKIAGLPMSDEARTKLLQEAETIEKALISG